MRLVAFVVIAGCGRIGFDPLGGTADGAFGLGHDGDPSRSNVVFISEADRMPDYGSVEGADQICRDEAAAAGLPGTFIAWLSSSTVPAAARLGGSRGWIRPDGEPVADTIDDMLAGKMFNPIDRTARNVRLIDPAEFVWTGTGGDGTADGTCDEWTNPTQMASATRGIAYRNAPAFTDIGLRNCTDIHRVYCFEIGYAAPVVPRVTAGARLAFVSLPQAVFDLNTHDLRCRVDANANGLPGTFFAAVATETTTIASRFSTAGPTWARLDGTAIAATAADLFAPDGVISFVNQDATGAYLLGSAGLTWSGAPDAVSVGTSGSTCSSWTSTTGNSALQGNPYTALGSNFWLSTPIGCDTMQRLLCLQM